MKRKAIITIIADGHEFFKIWYCYYRKFFNDSDIYILSFNSPESYIKDLTCNVIRCGRNIYDIGNYGYLTEFKNSLFTIYDSVMYADYDEIIYHPSGLDKFIDNCHGLRFATCTGYEIVQNRKAETAIDFNKSILAQRSYWCRANPYDKPAIDFDKISWGPGAHGLYDPEWVKSDRPLNRFEDLYLIHLHKIDYLYCYGMNLKNVNSGNKPVGGGNQNFYLYDQFEAWWNDAENSIVTIPDIIKQHGGF